MALLSWVGLLGGAAGSVETAALVSLVWFQPPPVVITVVESMVPYGEISGTRV